MTKLCSFQCHVIYWTAFWNWPLRQNSSGYFQGQIIQVYNHNSKSILRWKYEGIMFQNFYCYEIYYGIPSFLNAVRKSVSVFLTYEKTLKDCVFGIFSFNFDEILCCNHVWNKNHSNKHNKNKNNFSLSLKLKTKQCSTLSISLHVFWDQYCLGSTDDKTDRSLYCRLAGRSCGYSA